LGHRKYSKKFKQSEKFYAIKKVQKIIPSFTSFLHKIDIYVNNATRPVASFLGPLTNFSVNDKVTRFDGKGQLIIPYLPTSSLKFVDCG